MILKAFYRIFIIIYRSSYRSELFRCLRKQLKICLVYIWNFITAPLIYPLWWVLKKQVCQRIYDDRGLTWQIVMDELREKPNGYASFDIIRSMRRAGKFWFWLWTYGSWENPLGDCGLPKWFRDGKPTFKNIYLFEAIRNPRSNWNMLFGCTDCMLTPENSMLVTLVDTRKDEVSTSHGVSDQRLGEWFFFRSLQHNHKIAYFMYEVANKKGMFYFGYCGLEKLNSTTFPRFETSYRPNESK